MAKIHRTNDRIKLNIDGLVVAISPLSFHQKMEVQSVIMEGTPMAAMKGAALAIKYSVKEIKGLETEDGDYHLEVENGKLTDDCIDDLFNMEQSSKLTLVALNLLDKIPKKFIDPNTGEPIEGVKLLKGASGKKK